MLRKRSLRVETLEGRRLLTADAIIGELGGGHAVVEGRIFPERPSGRIVQLAVPIGPDVIRINLLPDAAVDGILRAMQGGEDA